MTRRDHRAWRPAPSGLDLAVENGQVVCPRRGPVDIETCFLCHDFGGFQDAPVERLICAANRDLDLLLGSFAVMPRQGAPANRRCLP